MRVSEAAKELGISPATVRKHITDGTLRGEKVSDPDVWPHGWRWELESASVEANRGRWKGRGKYRNRWLDDQTETVIVVSPYRRDHSAEEVEPMTLEPRGTRLVRYAFTAGVVLGTLWRVAMAYRQSSPP
jgi:hypothetical protein